jgi:hypothetical protein
MRQLFPRISADDVQGMAAIGVTPEYVREMRRQGLPASDPDQAIESRVLFSPRHAPRASAIAHAGAAAVASAVAISPDGIVARGADGSRAVIGHGGVAVRSADGSTAVINAPPGDDDDN